jgi:hypothetical protein
MVTIENSVAMDEEFQEYILLPGKGPKEQSIRSSIGSYLPQFSKDKEDFKVLLKFLIIEYSSGYSGFVSLWITIYQCIVIS